MNYQESGIVLAVFQIMQQSKIEPVVAIILLNRPFISAFRHNNSNNDTTNSYSFEYIKNIENIIDDILISRDFFIIDRDQFFNNTVVALVVANLADEVLRKCGHAFGVPSNVMLIMSFSNIFNNMQNESSDEIILNSSSKGMTHHPKNITANNSIIDKSRYINALEISKDD